MAQGDPGTQPSAPAPNEPWHDKVLTDAIGHTRGLVALLDSLNDAFLRRGQELLEVRQRLEILQSERRRIIEERATLDGQVRTLSEERDRSRTDLALRTRDLEEARAELERLRAEGARLHSALTAAEEEARTLHTAAASTTKQAEDLRRIVRGLERDRDTAARLHAEQLAALDHARERAEDSRVQHEATALRERIAQVERLLETAKQDAAAAESRAEAERGALVAERDAARRELERHVQALASVQDELAQARRDLEARAEVAPHTRQMRPDDGEPARLSAAVESLPDLVRTIQEILGTTQAIPDHLRDLLAQREGLTQRVQELTRVVDDLREDLAYANRQFHELQGERNRLAARVAALAVELKALRTAAAAPATVAPTPDLAAAPAEPPPEPPAPSVAAADARPHLPSGQPASARKSAAALELRAVLLPTPAGERAGDTVPLQLTGQVSTINHAGMVIALAAPLTIGQTAAVRLLRKGVTILVTGSIVRIQPSLGDPGQLPRVDHLIRFEHPGPESLAQLKAFLA